jgi:hypothetical protein
VKLSAILLALGAAAIAAVATLAPTSAVANASACGAGTHGSNGYAYAGFQSGEIAHGVRATITPLSRPTVSSGHVAGWVGVGGPGQGPNGETMWLQAGIAAIPGMPPMVYAEITRPGQTPVFVPLVENVEPGQRFRLSILEMSRRPDFWRVWLNDQPATQPVHLPGSTKRWRPIATAETWNGGTSTCNGFGFRFEQVGVARTKGGSWRAFAPGYTFLDRGYRVRKLGTGAGSARTLATGGAAVVEPYAFEAASTDA